MGHVWYQKNCTRFLFLNIMTFWYGCIAFGIFQITFEEEHMFNITRRNIHIIEVFLTGQEISTAPTIRSWWRKHTILEIGTWYLVGFLLNLPLGSLTKRSVEFNIKPKLTLVSLSIFSVSLTAQLDGHGLDGVYDIGSWH